MSPSNPGRDSTTSPYTSASDPVCMQVADTIDFPEDAKGRSLVLRGSNAGQVAHIARVRAVQQMNG